MKKMLLAFGMAGALFGGSVAWAENAATATPPAEDIVLVEETGETTLNNTADTPAAIAEAAPDSRRRRTA